MLPAEKELSPAGFLWTAIQVVHRRGAAGRWKMYQTGSTGTLIQTCFHSQHGHFLLYQDEVKHLLDAPLVLDNVIHRDRLQWMAWASFYHSIPARQGPPKTRVNALGVL
jgi:hypothetical protein